MAFTVKDWQDAPSTSTPLSAAALEDLETRVGAYADTVGAAGNTPTTARPEFYLGNATSSEFTGEANMPVQIAVYFGSYFPGGRPLTGRPQGYRSTTKYGGPTTADSAQGGSTQVVLPNTGSAFTQTLPLTANESNALVQGGNTVTGKTVGHSFSVEAHNTATVEWAIPAYFKNVAAKDAGCTTRLWTGIYMEDPDVGSAGSVPNREGIHLSSGIGLHVQDAITFGILSGVVGHFNTATSVSGTSITLRSGQGASFANSQTIMIGTGTLAEARTISGLSGDTFTVAALSKAHAADTIIRPYSAAGFGNLYMSGGRIKTDTNLEPPAVNAGQYQIRFSNGSGYFDSPHQTSDPGAISAGNARFFARASGGKSQWAVRHPTGPIQILATENGQIPTVASAASITIAQPHMNPVVVNVTGTTNISTLATTGEDGTVAILKFADVLTVSDGGGNLQLSANFVTSANDTLTLVCDSGAWYEVARSAN